MAYQSMQKSWFKMPAYSAMYNPAKKDIEGGDKIILNTGILQSLMQRFGERPLPHPLTFEIQNVKDRRISHCGVLEFSAEQSTAFLPAWMMLNMGLDEGQEVQLKLKELPLATSLVLQPLKWTFAQIPTPKIALEHALASFTALTAGDTISISVHGRAHSLTVVDIKPDTRMPGQKNACCVVNAHLEVDFLPPLEQEPESEQATPLALGEVRVGETGAAGSYRYYRVKTLDSGLAFQVEVTAHSGDPEVVVSTRTNKPALTDCTWKSVSSLATTSASRASASSRTRSITVSPTSIGYIVGWYYVGVLAYGTDATFDIVMREVVPPETEGPKAPAGPAVGSLSSDDPNARQCDNCKQFISQKAYSLHSAQCMRMNTYCTLCAKPIRKSEMAAHTHCPTCNLVLHPDDLQKHIDLVHKSTPCPECAEPVDPGHMQVHRREECKMRPAQCQYCHMEMAHRLVFEHQQICGAQTIPCERCQKPVSRKRMDIHFAVDHGINLSYRPGDRSSMGSAAPRITAQHVAQQHKQMAGFQPVKDDAAAAPVGPLSEDEEMARAIAQSLADEERAFNASAAAASSSYAASAAASHSSASSGMASAAAASPSGESNNLALQQALLESRFGSNGHSNGMAALSAGVSALEPLRSPPSAVFDGDARNDDWGAAAEEDEEDGGAAMDDGDDAVDTWSDDDADGHAPAAPASKAPRKQELDCPYCSAQHQTDAQLEKHMEQCAAVDD